MDTKADIITHYQVNEEDNDNKALLPAIEGSEQKCEKRHDVVDADSGFSSIENLEALEEKKQDALMPDKRFDVDERGEQKRGEYDRSHFEYNTEEDHYVCPAGNMLVKEAAFTLNNREHHRYSNPSACQKCPFKKECARGVKRTITRDANEKIKEDTRETLLQPENKELYKLRSHSAESPFGNIKHNLKFRIFMRRTVERVKIEVGLLRILHNILKISNFQKALCFD